MPGGRLVKRWGAEILFGLAVLWAPLVPGTAGAQLPFGEQRYEYELSDVLPGASVFEPVDNYFRGYASEGGELVGYVFLTDELVNIPGYSGESMNTLIGMNTEGTLTGVRIVRHSEPIVLIGLPESAIHEFTDQYRGKKITESILISHEPKPGYETIDGISGATVTAVAENATILEAARLVARIENIVTAAELRTERPSPVFEELSWDALVSQGAVRSIAVAPDQLHLSGGANLLDLRYAVLDPPSIGRNLLGDRFWNIVRARAERDGGSAVFIGGLGQLSFKGPGFARGGIFDRFVLEQGGDLFVFKDLDYIAMPELPAEGAPRFREGGVFFTDPAFDPTRPFTLRLTVPYRVGDERSYATFLAEYELPDRFIESETPFWMRRWQESKLAASFGAVLLLFLLVAFSLRNRLVRRRKLLHRTTAVLAAIVLGLMLKAQPSTTQILTFANALARFEFPSEIYLSEPLIFMLWIVIAVTLVTWGRGFFCGWVCPYGALLESLITIWERVTPKSFRKRFDEWEPPAYLRYGKIVVFLVILAVSFVSLPLAEAIDEIEPFKTFVLRLARPSAFVVYFVGLTLVSVVSYRFFCRFMCPLGGALAIPSTKKPLFPLFRYETCTRCKICFKGCEPKAISYETGRINYQECLQCWDCQATGMDEEVCPELIVAKKENRPVQILVGILLACFVGLGPGRGEAIAETFRVAPGSLPDAFDSAAPGDVLVLEPGVHAGALVINKGVVLRGEKGAVVDGGGSGHAILVAAPGVVVEGLTVRNCRVTDEFADAGIWVDKAASGSRVVGNTIEGCRFGIWIHGAADIEVSENRVLGIEKATHNERGDCIHLWDADGIRVIGNEVTHCRDGIYLELTSDGLIESNEISSSRYAVHTMWCDRTRYVENYAHDNLVGLALMFAERVESEGNILHNNRTHGMLWVQVTHGKAVDNVLIGNTKGMFVYNSLYNTIRGNLIARNNLGAHYWGGSEENTMEDNAFIENEIQVKFVAARDQIWGSNFWSDYAAWDADDDGKGDVPYRSHTLVDAMLWKYPLAKLLLASPAFQMLALAEREFPVITVPKAVDATPRMEPSMADWAGLLERYPAKPVLYYMEMEKLPHVPGENR